MWTICCDRPRASRHASGMPSAWHERQAVTSHSLRIAATRALTGSLPAHFARCLLCAALLDAAPHPRCWHHVLSHVALEQPECLVHRVIKQSQRARKVMEKESRGAVDSQAVSEPNDRCLARRQTVRNTRLPRGVHLCASELSGRDRLLAAARRGLRPARGSAARSSGKIDPPAGLSSAQS